MPSPTILCLIPFRQGLFPDPGVRLASQQTPDPPVCPPIGLELQVDVQPHLGVCMDAGIQTLVSCLHSKCSYYQAISPVPVLEFFPVQLLFPFYICVSFVLGSGIRSFLVQLLTHDLYLVYICGLSQQVVLKIIRIISSKVLGPCTDNYLNCIFTTWLADAR